MTYVSQGSDVTSRASQRVIRRTEIRSRLVDAKRVPRSESMVRYWIDAESESSMC
jgi:hypothetical protein